MSEFDGTSRALAVDFPIVPRRLVQIAAAAGILAIVVLSLVPGEWRPEIDFIPDPMQHALAYLVVSAATMRAFPSLGAQRLALAFAATACAFEFAQMFIELRTASLSDIASSLIGTVIGIAAAAQAGDRMLLSPRP